MRWTSDERCGEAGGVRVDHVDGGESLAGGAEVGIRVD